MIGGYLRGPLPDYIGERGVDQVIIALNQLFDMTATPKISPGAMDVIDCMQTDATSPAGV